ncbi:DUF924 family protein [Sphingomonas sp.]|uniref:DUF924 family protein n=1 Tax=Sphingomonas sp. TaxID=28214 RepID=UPI0035C7A65B
MHVADNETATAAVLDFWFGEVPAEKRFAKDEALDRTIAARFGALRDAVLANGAAGWRDTPEGLLAAVILLDQFSRNIHRGSAEAFAADPLALELTHAAIDRGWEHGYSPEQREFLLLPLMHAEDPEAQELCVAKFETLGDPEALAYAHDHREVLLRFGRFPSRNAALGRTSTPEEEAYLNQPGAGW